MKTIIVDIDGTLLKGNEPLVSEIREKGLEWLYGHTPEEFGKLHGHCTTVEPIVQLVRMMNGFVDVVVCTARPDKYRGVTKDWLWDNYVPYTKLYMRSDGDGREDWEVKRGILAEIDPKDVLLVIEDRESVVDMWRKEGLVCLQCAEGGSG